MGWWKRSQEERAEDLCQERYGKFLGELDDHDLAGEVMQDAAADFQAEGKPSGRHAGTPMAIMSLPDIRK